MNQGRYQEAIDCYDDVLELDSIHFLLKDFYNLVGIFIYKMFLISLVIPNEFFAFYYIR